MTPQTKEEVAKMKPKETAAGITRREFFPKAAATAIGAGALLSGQVPGASISSAAATDGVRYRMLGKTGISVSEIGFGSHLDDDKMGDPQGRAAVIGKGLEYGINLFDIYDHQYHQFELMSEVLEPVRQDVVISLVAMWNRDQTMEEVEYALSTFKTDVIDLYRIYWEPSMGPEEVETRFRILQQAKEQGKIRAVGLVSHDHATLTGVLQSLPELDYLMLPYNFQHQKFSPVTLVEAASWGQIKSDRAFLGSWDGPSPKGTVREMAEDCFFGACSDPELQPLIEETGVGILAIKPFAGGAAHNLSPSDPVLQELQEAGASLPQAALRFVLTARDIASAIGAMNSIDEVVENCAASGGDGFSQIDAKLLQIYADAAEESKGEYLPEHYRWLEEGWKA